MRKYLHLDKLIVTLETIAVAGRALTAIEVQKATGLAWPTCYRLSQTLADCSLVDGPEGNTRYVIGERLIRIAVLVKSYIDVRRACAPALTAAAVKFNETVFLCVFVANMWKTTIWKCPQTRHEKSALRSRCAKSQILT